ncbi:type II toxin-antitoxin system RelE/ParE family toxin [Winogradskyella forsetii]|uniref:type II toxin-antitoxin system RelE/ParE family toxin n=1 Tax=Winogradskyella forsetii TaxID=2686077 RepID=UPI0015BA84D8|nr:type II toxin-antitoxin system RelE/ParE family toxin [Winogradskyella forsetii]
MGFEIELSHFSKIDLKEARDYYFVISPVVLKRFDNELSETMERIAINPQHFQNRYRNIKIVFTKEFPFGIHYLVDGNTVYIQRILHQKRHYQ